MARQEDWTPRSVRALEKAGEPVQVWELVSLESILYQDEDGHDLTRLSCLSDWEDTPDVIVPKRLEAGVVHALVRCLPRQERKVLELHYWQEESYRRIGERFGVSESAVCLWHQAALSQLSLWLKERAHAG